MPRSMLSLLCLGLLTLATADSSVNNIRRAKTANETTIELDIIFPQNRTYETTDAPLPLVFALQNASEAAYFGYDLTWSLYLGDELKSSGEFAPTTNPTNFNYTSNNTAILADSLKIRNLEAGNYSLSWEVNTIICREIEGIPNEQGISGNKTTVADGTLYFSLADDEGNDIGYAGCAEHLGTWSLRSYNELNPSCPSHVNSPLETYECDPRFDGDQISCLTSFFRGDTNGTACRAGFDNVPEDADLLWNLADWNETAQEDGDGKGDGDLGVMHRPDLKALILVAVVVMGGLIAL
ncbi:hypothetical protein BJX70DRAFT_373941 [Aspergillus crustosus]